MTDTLHLGCGTDIRADAHNVDQLQLDGVDEQVDLAEFPWPWDDASWGEIVAEHVFEHLPDIEQALRESARILKPGGTLEVVMPIGMNAIADPDHEHVWIWDTPEYYTGKRHWDVDVGLEVVDRGVTIHPHLNGVFGAMQKAWLELYKHLHGPGRWMFDVPITSGEFTVVFQK